MRAMTIMVPRRGVSALSARPVLIEIFGAGRCHPPFPVAGKARMAPHASTVVIDDAQRKRLQGLTRSRTAPYREVQRARIVLAAADAMPNAAIARQLSISEDTVRTWR